MKTAEPIRNKHQVRQLAHYFIQRGELRNHALVVLGVHTALRISDLLCLTWDDVYDFDRGCLRQRLMLTERKTGKPKTILLNKSVLSALRLYIHAAAPGKMLF